MGEATGGGLMVLDWEQRTLGGLFCAIMKRRTAEGGMDVSSCCLRAALTRSCTPAEFRGCG